MIFTDSEYHSILLLTFHIKYPSKFKFIFEIYTIILLFVYTILYKKSMIVYLFQDDVSSGSWLRATVVPFKMIFYHLVFYFFYSIITKRRKDVIFYEGCEPGKLDKARRFFDAEIRAS